MNLESMGELISKNYEWAVCITHDVDHLSHHISFNGVKFLGVCAIETFMLKRSIGSFISTALNFIRSPDSWDTTEELAGLNKKYRIPATYFFAVKKGHGIEYGIDELKEALGKLHGFEIGVHGQAYKEFEEVKEENEIMKQVLGKKPLGIRMHYLNFDKEKTPGILEQFYSYDSSEYSEELKQPYMISKNLVEIPLHIMDTHLFSPFYKNFTLEKAKEFTLEKIEHVKKEHKLLVVNVHQRSISEDFSRHREYYSWLLDFISKDKLCEKLFCSDIAERVLENRRVDENV